VHFIRTTDLNHIASAQAFWNKVKDNGFIYKKNYASKYCVGCESEKTDSDLNENGEYRERRRKYFFKYIEFGESFWNSCQGQTLLLEFRQRSQSFY
jgi:methionyl-tRNA synthetase